MDLPRQKVFIWTSFSTHPKGQVTVVFGYNINIHFMGNAKTSNKNIGQTNGN